MKSYSLKSIVLFIFFMGLLLVSCEKYEDPIVEKNKSIYEINVNPQFDWKTSKEITINVKGLPISTSIKNNLIVKSIDNKSVYFIDQLEINKDYTLKFTVPSFQNQIIIQYGTIIQKTDLIGNTVQFSYNIQ